MTSEADGTTVIIGGGFSGTMVAAQLARAGRKSIVIDDAPKRARGVAYGGDDPLHRLNVPIEKMSAWPDRPSDFADYLAREGREAPCGFATRADYGDYLDALFQQAEASGHARRVAGRAAKVDRHDGHWRVTLEDGETVEGRELVLAIGNPPPDVPRALRSVDPADRVDQPWGAQGLKRLRAAAAGRQPVLIVGTSLTMVDVALSLDAMGHAGPVIAVSRRGLVPRAHAAEASEALPVPDDIPSDLSKAARWMRTRAKGASDWRQAVDSVRHVTRDWWEGLDLVRRKRFLRHARPWWDVHRHRLSPDVAERIDALQRQGWLRIVAGQIASIDVGEGDYIVRLAKRGGGEERLIAGLVVDCTGPGSVLARAPMPGMIEASMVEPDALGLGIEVDAVGHIRGQPFAYAIGTLARGSRWETTAVPDLRGQAEAIARAILERGD